MSESARDSHTGSIDTLMLAYLCMAANGTDDYEKIATVDRGTFEHYTLTGQLFGEIEKLKVDAEVEARTFDLQIPEEALSVYCMSRVQLGIPLPQAVRDHLGAITTRLLALILRVSAARRMRLWNTTRTDNVLPATPTHDPFAKAIALQVAEQTEPKSLPAHVEDSPGTEQPKPADEFRPYRIDNDFLIIALSPGSVAVELTLRQRQALAPVIAAGVGGVKLSGHREAPVKYSDYIGQVKDRLRDAGAPNYLHTPGNEGKGPGAGGVYAIRPSFQESPESGVSGVFWVSI